MKTFNKNFKIGTKVQIKYKGCPRWFSVKTIHETRKWVEVNGLAGSFQRDSIEKFSNTAKEEWRWDSSLFNYNYSLSATSHLSAHQYVSTDGRYKITIERVEDGKVVFSKFFKDKSEFLVWWGDKDMNSHDNFKSFINANM